MIDENGVDQSDSASFNWMRPLYAFELERIAELEEIARNQTECHHLLAKRDRQIRRNADQVDAFSWDTPIVCSDTGKPYVVPAVFEIELQDRIEFWESEVEWARYHLEVAQNFAEQIRKAKEAA